MGLETVIQSEVSQKEKNKYINTYMWNLEKWYRWTGLQDRNRDTGVPLYGHQGEKVGVGGWWDELGGWDWHTYTNMYKVDN